MNQTLSRVLSWVLALVVGAVYGTAGTIAHAYRLGPIPVGLILAVIGIAALFVALRALTGDRWTALCGGVGALAATVVFSGSGPGGDVVVPGGDLDLLRDEVGNVVFLLPVKITERRLGECADTRQLRGGYFVSTNEFLQTSDGLVTGLHDDRKRPVAVIITEELMTHSRMADEVMHVITDVGEESSAPISPTATLSGDCTVDPATAMRKSQRRGRAPHSEYPIFD